MMCTSKGFLVRSKWNKKSLASGLGLSTQEMFHFLLPSPFLIILQKEWKKLWVGTQLLGRVTEFAQEKFFSLYQGIKDKLYGLWIQRLYQVDSFST